MFAARVIALATLALLSAATNATAASTVHIRGTAYEFNNVKVKLAGATVKVDELPSVSATVKADGTYDLTVPANANLTPYITLAGYRTIYLQTFTTAGEDLERVNFQVPTEGVAVALAQLLQVPVDADNVPLKCVIVSTFSTRNVRGLGVTFDDFTGYGAHGVAGATASLTPAAVPPVYFNESVLPDRGQKLSSKDGGVIWTDVPDGVYTVKAASPKTKFASFTATCKPGRIVNANPPWGLHELGKKNPTTAKATWSGKRLRSLTLKNAPKGFTLEWHLGSQRFPSKSTRIVSSINKGFRTLAPGKTFEVQVTAPGYDSAVFRYTLKAGRPTPTKLCVPLGNTLPRARC